jgi:hypothetical protein
LLLEPDDGRPGGWSQREFAEALATAQGRRALAINVPAPLVRMGARIDSLVRRGKAMLTPDRAAMYCHPDWAVDPARHPPAELWQPQVPTLEGLAETARWYQRQGWL